MDEKPHYLGHIDRLRKRFIKTGSDGMHDYEVLELLLSYVLRGRDVKPLAKELIKKFGSVKAVLDADIKELREVKGIGKRSAVLIKVVKDFTNIYFSENIKKVDVMDSPAVVIQFAKTRIGGQKNETFMIVYVNKKNHVLDYEIFQEGTVDKTVIFPRKIMESALACHATGIILIHNHPSDSYNPSAYDRKLTRSIQNVANHLDIHVIDHLIVGEHGHYSFKENKMI